MNPIAMSEDEARRVVARAERTMFEVYTAGRNHGAVQALEVVRGLLHDIRVRLPTVPPSAARIEMMELVDRHLHEVDASIVALTGGAATGCNGTGQP